MLQITTYIIIFIWSSYSSVFYLYKRCYLTQLSILEISLVCKELAEICSYISICISASCNITSWFMVLNLQTWTFNHGNINWFSWVSSSIFFLLQAWVVLRGLVWSCLKWIYKCQVLRVTSSTQSIFRYKILGFVMAKCTTWD